MLQTVQRYWLIIIGVILLSAGLFGTTSYPERTYFSAYFIGYISAFAGYVVLYLRREVLTVRSFFWILAVAFIASSCYPPYLSNDYYRFLWDGELICKGINPFDYTPRQIIHDLATQSAHWKHLYNGMGELQQSNYSCYPPVNQWYFILPAAITNDPFTQILILRILIGITMSAGLYWTFLLLKQLQIPWQSSILFFLNPLVLIEGIANLHFEVVLFSFLIGAIYLLINGRNILGSFVLALAVGLKLIPLILFPLILKWKGWKQSFSIFISVICWLVAFSLPFFSMENFPHFLSSIHLYFRLFEFNSSWLYMLTTFDPFEINYFKVAFYQPLLSILTFGIICGISWFRGKIRGNQLFVRMTLIYAIYLLFSSTVHPWYLIPLLGLSMFTSMRFAVSWTGLVFLSYLFYSTDSWTSKTVITLVEYMPILFLLVWEMKPFINQKTYN